MLLPNLQANLSPLTPHAVEGTFWLRAPKRIRCDTRYNSGESWVQPKEQQLAQVLADWFK